MAWKIVSAILKTRRFPFCSFHVDSPGRLVRGKEGTADELRVLHVRDFTGSTFHTERTASLQIRGCEVPERLPGSQTVTLGRINRTTCAVLFSAAAPAEKENYIQRALQHVQTVGPAMGLDKHQLRLNSLPMVQETNSRRARGEFATTLPWHSRVLSRPMALSGHRGKHNEMRCPDYPISSQCRMPS